MRINHKEQCKGRKKEGLTAEALSSQSWFITFLLCALCVSAVRFDFLSGIRSFISPL